MELSSKEINNQVSLILESPLFSGSPRKKQLLSYLIEQTLKGDEAKIKSYNIGIDVFGRSDDFDPQIDSVVRVQAGSLRKALKMYYLTEGKNDPIIIRLPKGAYVPTFSTSHNFDEQAADIDAHPISETVNNSFVSQHVFTMLALFAFFSVAISGWLVLDIRKTDEVFTGYPVVAVLPFDNFTGEETNDIFELGFQRQLASDLERFRIFRVITSSPTTNPSTKADYYISGALIDLSSGYDIMFSLQDQMSGNEIRNWRVNFGLDQMQYHDALKEISTLAAAEIAGTQGRLRNLKIEDVESRVGVAALNHHDIFECVVKFDDFIIDKSSEKFGSSYKCIETKLARYPDDSTLNAMLAWMVALASPEAHQHLSIDFDAAEPFSVNRAYELALSAVASDPRNDTAHTYLGLIEWLRGDRQSAILSLRRAEDINPGDPTTKADLGLFLSLSGNWDEGLDYTDQAIRESALPPPWFELPRIYRALLDGDGRRANSLLLEYEVSGDPYLPHYLFAAASISGDNELMEIYKKEIADYASKNDGDVMRGLNVWLGDSEVKILLENTFREYEML